MNFQNINLYKLADENKVSERIYKTSMQGLFFINDPIFADERGFFKEVAIIPDIELVLKEQFVIRQINHARSKKNVVRGMHAEDWDKLITVISGTAFCALSDIRVNSETFTKTEYFLLGDGEDAIMGSLFIKSGIANSVCALEDNTDYLYAVSKIYREKQDEDARAISVFDPILNIKWPISKEEMIISDRDKNAVFLKDLHSEKFT
jgi:dTDP-4-dehydrorhamnose 3,5-epimerase